MSTKNLHPVRVFVVLMLITYSIGGLSEASLNIAEWDHTFRRQVFITGAFASGLVTAIIGVGKDLMK